MDREKLRRCEQTILKDIGVSRLQCLQNLANDEVNRMCIRVKSWIIRVKREKDVNIDRLLLEHKRFSRNPYLKQFQKKLKLQIL